MYTVIESLLKPEMSLSYHIFQTIAHKKGIPKSYIKGSLLTVSDLYEYVCSLVNGMFQYFSNFSEVFTNVASRVQMWVR